MREFAQVMPTFWTGETGRALKGKPELQTLALYLITSPHANAFGLYYLPLPFIVHETGLTEKKVLAAFQKLTDFCRYDRASEFVWVIAMAGFQIGNLASGDKRIKGFQRAWQSLPHNPFTGPFFEKYGEKYGFERRASKGLTDTKKGLPLETETDTETETETEKETEPSSPDGSVVPAPAGPTPEHLFALWNERAHPNLPRCEILSDKRKSHARSRLRQYPDRPFWDRLMEKVNRSKFLTGEAGGQRPFKCTFDWILNETNLIKIIEGNYDGR